MCLKTETCQNQRQFWIHRTIRNPIQGTKSIFPKLRTAPKPDSSRSKNFEARNQVTGSGYIPVDKSKKCQN